MKLYIPFIFFLFTSLIISCTTTTEKVVTVDQLALNNDSSDCIACHDDISPTWQTSHHAKSLTDSAVLISLQKEMVSAGTAREKTFKSCVSCHAPQINSAPEKTVEMIISLVSNVSDKEGDLSLKEAQDSLSSFSVDCIVCHMSRAMPEGELTPDTIYGPGWDEHEHSHMKEYGFDTIKSEYLGSQEFCKNCHQSMNGSISGELAGTHRNDHVLNSANTGSSCKDCHMVSGHAFRHNAK